MFLKTLLEAVTKFLFNVKERALLLFRVYFHINGEEESSLALNPPLECSWNEEEDRIRRQKREEEIEIDEVIKESLKLAEEKKSNDKGKRKLVADVEEVNPPLPSICNGCKSELVDGISANPQCLCCIHCHKPIAMHEISKRGQFHRHCYKDHRHPNCYVCKKKIPQTEEGIKYSEHAFWKEKYCPSHDDDGTAKCCSCERLEPKETNFVMLGDDRWLCLECLDSSIMYSDECHPLHVEIRDFFEGLLFKVDKEFPLLLVEKQTLNKDDEEEEKIDYRREVVTRGLCMSEEQIVTKMGVNNQLLDMVTETQRVGGVKVTGIFIIYGLPRLLTGYILAHEMMHAWLRLNGYRNLKLELEEGLCQALGLIWLEAQKYTFNEISSSPPRTTSYTDEYRSGFEKKLLEFCINQIIEDDSPVYGHGFRQVHQMLVSNHYNIKDTLKDIVSASKQTNLRDLNHPHISSRYKFSIYTCTHTCPMHACIPDPETKQSEYKFVIG